MERSFVNPPSVAPPVGNYSHAVVVDTADARWIFISGQVALDAERQLVGGDSMAAQTEAVMSNIQAILEANGATWSDVVKTNTFVTDISRIGEVREARARFLPPGQDPPTSTLVEVKGLAVPGLLIETEAIAVVAR